MTYTIIPDRTKFIIVHQFGLELAINIEKIRAFGPFIKLGGDRSNSWIDVSGTKFELTDEYEDIKSAICGDAL